MSLGALTFLHPLALLGLLALPLIWWVLKITPPKPLLQTFPPLRLLYDLKKQEDTPNKTPWWLLLYRLMMGAVLAVAMASPILFKPETTSSRPLALVIDNGWAGAGNWSSISREAEALIRDAVRDNREIALMPSATEDIPAHFIPASQALQKMKALHPVSWEPDRKALGARLNTIDLSKADVFWLSDGVDYGQAKAFAKRIHAGGTKKIYLPAPEKSPVYAGKTSETAEGFRSLWHRINASSARSLKINAYDAKGLVLGTADLSFGAGSTKAEALFELPAELRNRAARLEIQGLASAGAVLLLDDNWGRPLVGLLKGNDENTQPLLSEWHYIEEALRPKADIFKGDLEELLAVSPSIIFMSDRARTTDTRLKKYVEDGGMLIRFAGPRLAKRPDTLLPVRLRKGDRQLGGALAWETPQGLDDFSKESPFFGLSPQEDIRVKKQVLAIPGAETDTHTWARLKDGSPVITSAKIGNGRVVLFHVTAGPEWSSLPISGLYVKMLDRLLPLARANVNRTETRASQVDWTAERTLDGFGRATTPSPQTRPIPDKVFTQTKPSPLHPPGIYKQGLRRQAINTIYKPERFTQLAANGFSPANYGGRTPKSLSGLLLAILALMLALDVFMSLLASGRLRRSVALAVMALMGAGIGILPENARAQTAPGYEDALGLHLAYVETGNPQIDRLSKLGLEGLVFELTRRTTIEPKGVRAVNIDTDELSYYPFLYWPVTRNTQALRPETAEKLNRFMAAGGTLVLDTQDQERRRLFASETHPGLALLSKNLDIPRLTKPLTTPAEKAHVLTKSFYLIQTFPGRWADGPIWVEAGNSTARDGVSSVIVGSNDWASSWAKDEKGRTVAVIENEIPRQREMAIRFGVNLVMYSLTGNYKSDGVHTAKIIERLGESPEGTQPLSTPGQREELK